MERNRGQYQMLIYQVPSQPSAARVGVWRELKRMGALYLQQSVCILPNNATLRAQLEAVAARVAAIGGTYHLLPVRSLPEAEEAKIVRSFQAQSTLQYDEIIENCEVNFAKEIEFETYRQNFTYAEAEEIRQDLEKIRRWYDRVVERDWFGAARREDAASWIARCETLLEQFEEKVFAVQQHDEMNGMLDGTAQSADGGSTARSMEPPRALRPRRGSRAHKPRKVGG
jgi:hypothetical protein